MSTPSASAGPDAAGRFFSPTFDPLASAQSPGWYPEARPLGRRRASDPMAAPKIEEYEQLLAQSPSSAVFADLAAALIQQGSYERAVQVCSQSLAHHQNSVSLHVLWGRALIGLGRAAAAMEQFEKAIAVNPQDPHPYRLISDVLLKKGLYRSALPILRKLVALQPADAKLQQALEHAQIAAGKGSGTPGRSLFAPVLAIPASSRSAAEAAAGRQRESCAAETGPAANERSYGRSPALAAAPAICSIPVAGRSARPS